MQTETMPIVTAVPTREEFFERFVKARREDAGYGAWEPFAKDAGFGVAGVYRILNHEPTHLTVRNALARGLKFEDWRELVERFEAWQAQQRETARPPSADEVVSLWQRLDPAGRERAYEMIRDALKASLAGKVELPVNIEPTGMTGIVKQVGVTETKPKHNGERKRRGA